MLGARVPASIRSFAPIAPQVRLHEGFVLGIGEIVEALRLDAIAAHPSHEQHEQHGHVGDFGDEPQQVAREVLVVQLSLIHI